ncbi:hypothetical protein D9757_007423 [Collybiopsis confluens]|uniref:Uncharacterized protein n=1 Tax=Collybiopsis confluens TaxID=2823264 RepID=A0A8H5M7T2_9AGAR|nr:hypothetical protein D9757_007423 [Collybiopsis confluens]
MRLTLIGFLSLISTACAVPFVVRERAVRESSNEALTSSNAPSLLTNTAILTYTGGSRTNRMKNVFRNKASKEKAANAAETAVKALVLAAHQAGTLGINGKLSTWVKSFNEVGTEKKIKFIITQVEKCREGCQGVVDEVTGEGVIKDGEGKELFKKANLFGDCVNIGVLV